MKKRNKAITCKDRFGDSKSLLYLSGLNSSGLGHRLGSRCRGHVGTMTTMSFGITRPLISMFALATRSRRGAMGYNRRDSLMTLSRYSICIRAWYSTGAFTDTHTQDVDECCELLPICLSFHQRVRNQESAWTTLVKILLHCEWTWPPLQQFTRGRKTMRGAKT